MRFVNVVDLMRLQDETEHPHGLSGAQFDALFTADRPVIFAYHGYPWLIHRLTYRRTNHRNLHVRGYKEEGTTTTPFDIVMLNDMDRYHLVMDVIDRVPGLGQRAAGLRQEMVDERLRKRAYTREHGDDRRGHPGLGLAVLVVNAGSSSLKLRLIGPDDELLRRPRPPAAAGGPRRGADRAGDAGRGRPPDRARRRALPRARSLIDADVEAALRELTALAPLHQPKSLAALDAVQAVLPGRAGGRLLRHGVSRRR